MSPHIITTASLDWNEQGTPVAEAFDDVYFSNDNGLAETRYVFLGQNGLPARFIDHDRAQFVVAETGFGTGLNFLATWQAFRHYRRHHANGNTKRLHFISVEKFPLTRTDLQKALAHWPELAELSQRLLAAYPLPISGCHRLWLDEDTSLDLWLGDVAELLPQMEAGLAGKVDAWYLDGFAPSKNPEMWTPALFSQLARLARPCSTLATFTSAGFVRRGLLAAGFEMAKVKGFGRKRDMLAGRRRVDQRLPYAGPWYWRRPGQGDSTLIVGAGIAGAALAHSLTRRGHRVTLVEQTEPANGASGNHQGAIYPLLNGDHDSLSRFYLQAFLYGRRALPRLAEQANFAHDWCGVVQLAHDAKSSAKIDKLLAGRFPNELVEELAADAVSRETGLEVELPGVRYPLGGWVCPAELTRAFIYAAEQTGLLDRHYHTRVTGFEVAGTGFVVDTTQGQYRAHNLVLASGHQLTQWPQTRELALYPVRGQVNHQPSQPPLEALKTVVCYDGYLTPAWRGRHCIGASYGRNQSSLDYRPQEERDNLNKLTATLPVLQGLSPEAGAGRVGIRAACRDHLPLVGAAANKAAQLTDYQGLHRTPEQLAPLADDVPGLYVLSGLGSRGLCSAPLLAEVLAAQLLDEPYPLAKDLLAALAPNRHWVRKLLKGKAVD
ncbi:bifunctional tRNA (5-methylaminomethyl-2-thiouridine)(34)-methyltransferase MnmD/FAD-dependent 5-carboxymethylaminomethyl-2-thiouridine(34) oxidoreductase MnmC [Zobellella aerophila]|uniref:bifunctional tRNA (5-methylaminomethyl-2-thiouridine)(34)-methyltransferase MnmD/FAD-dependent 5-carboxymethylaminomethyl-2-thiouridine(34) oxidoreductase MnmC n=1 Tax=Zobellella aerophila TaxID=870480 RepID=UPI0031EAA104